jgi:transposase InsO family protein
VSAPPSVGARDIISELEQLFERHGKPRLLRSDNGREFIAETLADWLKDQGVTQVFIEKASPQQTRMSSGSTARCATSF